MTESENKAITISNMSKLLLQQIVPRIKTLHARKKEVLDNFDKARSRIEREFVVSTNEKTRLETNYKDAIRDAAKWREKLDDSYSKVKGIFFNVFLYFYFATVFTYLGSRIYW